MAMYTSVVGNDEYSEWIDVGGSEDSLTPKLPLSPQMTLFYERTAKKYIETSAALAGVHKLKSGLLFKILQRGKGQLTPEPDDSIDIYYVAKLKDGTIFESSVRPEVPTKLTPQDTIYGLGEALLLMAAGDKWELYVPYELAYGEDGDWPKKIPPYSPLYYEVEVVKVYGKGRDKREAMLYLKQELKKKYDEL